MIRRPNTVRLPGVIAASAIIIAWGVVNELFHVGNAQLIGYVWGTGGSLPGNHSLVFEGAVFLMAAAMLGAAAVILWMSIKKG
jgi:hypothetical protein